MVAPIITTLRTNNLWNSISKETVGSNVPHCLLVANKNELYDQAMNQFGNTAMVFGGGFAVSKLIDKTFSKINPDTFTKQAFHHPVSNKWYMLGKSFAIYSFIAGYVLASPFIRNLITSKRTKTSNYAEMVGLSSNKNTPQQIFERKQKEKKYQRQFTKTLGVGWGISAAILAATQLLAKKHDPFGKTWENIHKYIGLPKGDYKQLKDLPTYLFWAVPCYLGLYLGSRDKLEQKEIIYRAGGFGLAFIVLPRTLEKIANKKLEGKTFKRIGPSQNAAYLVQLISGILFYTSIPTVVNLLKRKDRAAEYGLASGTSQKRTLFFLNRHETQ